MNFNQLFEKTEKSNPIDFGDIFSKSMELYKKVWIQGLVHFLISVVILIPLVLIMYLMAYIPIIAMVGVVGYEESYGGYPNHIEGVSIGVMILSGLFVLVIAMIASALLLGLRAHFYILCRQVDMQLPEENNYFMFFKKKYLGKIFMLTMAIFGVILLAVLLCYIPVLYVMVPMQLLVVIFAFNPDISVSELIKISFKLGNKIWLMAFLLMLVTSFVTQTVGMMTCGVGLLFVASFAYMPIYYMYKDTIGFEDESELENMNKLIE